MLGIEEKNEEGQGHMIKEKVNGDGKSCDAEMSDAQ